MVWLEFNIHIRNRVLVPLDLFKDGTAILRDLVKPFVDGHRTLFVHWHYLLEPDICRGEGCYEVRLRFECSQKSVTTLRDELVAELGDFVTKSHLAMRENEPLGSHEGEHGRRGMTYLGAQSEEFGRDWNTIVDIMEKGSENALAILDLGRTLVEAKSIQPGIWRTTHPYYTHLPANQLLVE